MLLSYNIKMELSTDTYSEFIHRFFTKLLANLSYFFKKNGI